MQLGRQAAGGVGQHNVDATGFGGGNGIKNHGGRVAVFLGDDGDVVALAPDFKLFAGGGAESVASSEQDALALALVVMGQLAD